MADELIFYTNPMSRGQIVRWMLEEIGELYDLRVLDLTKGENRQPDYLAINPMGKVPALVHDGVVITEVAAICWCCFLRQMVGKHQRRESSSPHSTRSEMTLGTRSPGPAASLSRPGRSVAPSGSPGHFDGFCRVPASSTTR